MNAHDARLPYRTVFSGAELRRFRLFRTATGTLSLARFALLFAVVLVFVPLMLACVYFAALASPRFVSETHLSVRSASVAAADWSMDVATERGSSGAFAMPGPGGLAPAGGQEAFVVASYVTSPAILEQLDGDGWLRARFARPEIDRLSRLDPEASREALFRHWRRHVTAAVDRRSGVVVLRVRAYTPEDAAEIARRTVSASEEMLVALTRRQREDTLAIAQLELAAAQARLARVIAEQRELRRATRTIDPAREAVAGTAALMRLIGERAQAQAERDALQASAGDTAPGLEELEAQLAALGGEIARARAGLTGPGADSVLAAITALERIELDRRFAQTWLRLATSAHRVALEEATRQLSFVLVFAGPTLPDEAKEPEALLAIALVAVLGLLAFLFATTATAIALDQTS